MVPLQPDSGLQAALLELEKQRHRLSREVQHLGGELEQFRQESQSLWSSLAPLIEQARYLDEQVHRLFDEIFSTETLDADSRQRVQELYAKLQGAGFLSWRPESAATGHEASLEEEPPGNAQGGARTPPEQPDAGHIRPASTALEPGLRDAAALEDELIALEHQRSALAEELSSLQQSDAGRLLLEYRRLQDERPDDSWSFVVKELAADVARVEALYSAVSRFHAGSIDLADLLRGPAPDRTGKHVTAIVEEFLGLRDPDASS